MQSGASVGKVGRLFYFPEVFEIFQPDSFVSNNYDFAINWRGIQPGYLSEVGGEPCDGELHLPPHHTGLEQRRQNGA